jgi:hypothetical protein
MILLIAFVILNVIDIFQTREILIQEIEANPFVKFLGFKLFIVYKILMVSFVGYIFYPFNKASGYWMFALVVFYIWVTVHNYRILKSLS